MTVTLHFTDLTIQRYMQYESHSNEYISFKDAFEKFV